MNLKKVITLILLIMVISSTYVFSSNHSSLQSLSTNQMIVENNYPNIVTDKHIN